MDEKRNKVFSRTSVFFICFIGFLCRFYQLGDPGLIGDELITAFRVDRPFIEAIDLLRHSSFPPLYYVILNLWVSIFADSEWSLRFISASFSGLTVFVVYKLGKELFGRQVGLFAAAVLALSSFNINFAQTAKPYGLFWFLTSLSFLFFFRYVKDGSNRAFICYLWISVFSCYTMYAGYLLLLTQNIMLLVLRNRWGWRKWLIGQVYIMAACMPWVLWFLASSKDATHSQPVNIPYDFSLFFRNLFCWISGVYCFSWNKALAFCYSFLIAFLVIWRKNINNQLYSSLWLGILVPLVSYCVANVLVIHEVLSVRHIGFIQIPLILLFCSQAVAFKGHIRSVFIVLLMIFTVSQPILYFKYNFRMLGDGDHVKMMVQDLRRRLGPKDVVLSFLDTHTMRYYFKNESKRFHYVFETQTGLVFLDERNLVSEVHIKELVNKADSLFVVYENEMPQLQLDGYDLNYNFSNDDFGFAHYYRVGLGTGNDPNALPSGGLNNNWVRI